MSCAVVMLSELNKKDLCCDRFRWAAFSVVKEL